LRGQRADGEVVGPRLVAFRQAATVAPWADRVRVPGFNPFVDGSVACWPQVRNRERGQALHLVSHEAEDGWGHDLWLPGYVWAHTPDRWRPPLVEGPTAGNTWRVRVELLADALVGLRRAERRPGCRWAVADEVD